MVTLVGDADLRAQHNEIPNRRTLPEMPVCADNHAMPADRHIVADLDQIVDLGALADHGIADGAAVDGRIGADLDVVLDDDAADLRHFQMALSAPSR